MTTRARHMLALMDGASIAWVFPILGPEKVEILRDVIRRHRPARALEIGSLFGYSAIAIADALGPRGRLTCVEVNPYLARFVEANVGAAGLGRRVRVVVGDARRVVPRLRERFDLVLIDAAKEQYLAFLRAVEPRLAPRAVVVADNTGVFRRQVQPYLRAVSGPGWLTREHAVDGDRMAVSVRRARPAPARRR